ncbi:uncharacterized protein [Nothobranchius furzeri]|uniref:uncharacterized protein n=1 Tax=Nothobranchius furzeri TaxID=105023 RepID=UPI0039048D2D
MDLLNDDQTSLAGSQTEDLLTVTELLDSSKPFLNTDPDGLRCLLQGDRPSLGFSSEDEIKDSPEPEREALPFLPQHCHKFLPTQSVPTDVKQESCFLLVNDAGSPESSGDVASEDLTKPFPTKHTSVTGSLRTQSDTSDIDTIVGPVADLYIHEGDTHDFILSRTDGPRETACPEYQPGADSYPHVLMCDPEVTQCHLGFGEAQVLQNVSQMSQHQELQPPAADATSLIDLMSVSDVRLDDDVSSSPVELWVDACQCLMGEDKEEQVVLDAADCSMMQGHQESGYNLDESKELGCSSDVIRDRGPPVERWSSVDS